MLYFTQKITENALYLLDEPENSLAPARVLELADFLQDATRFFRLPAGYRYPFSFPAGAERGQSLRFGCRPAPAAPLDGAGERAGSTAVFLPATPVNLTSLTAGKQNVAADNRPDS